MKKIPYEKMGRQLVWSEEFDSPVLDAGIWRFAQTMTNPDVLYDNSAKNIRVENNELLLQVNRTDNASLPYTTCQGLTTKYNFGFKYGYLEMRAKLPFRRGAWPSLWLMAQPDLHNTEIGWSAEIDIFEVFASANSLAPNLHKWGPSPEVKHVMLPGEEDQNGRLYYFGNPESLNDEYHRYGFEWDEREMKFYIDDTCYYTFDITEANDFGTDQLPGMGGYHEYMYLIINNEIFTHNSSWCPDGAALEEDDPLPIDYHIDYIRLYQDKNSESTVVLN